MLLLVVVKKNLHVKNKILGSA